MSQSPVSAPPCATSPLSSSAPAQLHWAWELSASRLLSPLGNNQIVWAALIGLILFYLALGAWLGGVLADRYPQRRALDMTVTLGAVGIALVPLLSTPVLRMAASGLARFDSGLLAGGLLAVLLLFAIPATLLGTATPWAIRLSVQEIGQTGHVAGRMSAIATAGSLVGTFVPCSGSFPRSARAGPFSSWHCWCSACRA
ncbi:MAG: fused MFS/spermidine synthase [Caldilineaceae bacterium]